MRKKFRAAGGGERWAVPLRPVRVCIWCPAKCAARRLCGASTPSSPTCYARPPAMLVAPPPGSRPGPLGRFVPRFRRVPWPRLVAPLVRPLPLLASRRLRGLRLAFGAEGVPTRGPTSACSSCASGGLVCGFVRRAEGAKVPAPSALCMGVCVWVWFYVRFRAASEGKQTAVSLPPVQGCLCMGVVLRAGSCFRPSCAQTRASGPLLGKVRLFPSSRPQGLPYRLSGQQQAKIRLLLPAADSVVSVRWLVAPGGKRLSFAQFSRFAALFPPGAGSVLAGCF